ncbi:uncharacterized protein LOC144887813 [Branchiostoma floridae x Branchiostoma japonicum]
MKMKSGFADVDTHAVLLMEEKEMKTYRQKLLAEKQQHDLQMNLLEKERRIAWNSDRVEQNRLLSRLENINKRILAINKENSRKLRQQTRLPERARKTSQKKLDENEKNATVTNLPFLSSTWPGGMGYLDVFQDLHGVTQKQGGLKLDPDTKPFRSRATSVPEHPFIQQTLYHIPVTSRLDKSPHKISSKSKEKGDHRRPSKTTDENTKEPVKPRLARRQSMDPKLLASLLNVDESAVQKQNQIFQRARLNSDAALRVSADRDMQENPEEGRKDKKKIPIKIQRRASVESMHLSSDLLKVGFPDWKAREQMLPMSVTWPNPNKSPTGPSAASRARRSSLPSLSTGTLSNLSTKPGSTSTRRTSIGATKLRTSSLDRLENVIEESEEHLR